MSGTISLACYSRRADPIDTSTLMILWTPLSASSDQSEWKQTPHRHTPPQKRIRGSPTMTRKSRASNPIAPSREHQRVGVAARCPGENSIPVESLAETKEEGQSSPVECLAETGQSIPVECLAETKEEGQSSPVECLAETKEEGQSIPVECLAETGQSSPVESLAETKEEGQSSPVECLAETKEEGQSSPVECLA
jgi:hypothetical protein